MKLILLFLLPSLVWSFCPPGKKPLSVALRMNSYPKFDKASNKWVTTSPDQGPENGYDLMGTLLRQGPQPAFQRVFKPDDYEQAILKFMAGDKVDRLTAQAEMDAYLRNPNDWAYNRLQGYKVDYAKIDTKQIVLTLVWGTFILSLGGRGLYCLQTGDYYWEILGLLAKNAS